MSMNRGIYLENLLDAPRRPSASGWRAIRRSTTKRRIRRTSRGRGRRSTPGRITSSRRCFSTTALFRVRRGLPRTGDQGADRPGHQDPHQAPSHLDPARVPLRGPVALADAIEKAPQGARHTRSASSGPASRRGSCSTGGAVRPLLRDEQRRSGVTGVGEARCVTPSTKRPAGGAKT